MATIKMLYAKVALVSRLVGPVVLIGGVSLTLSGLGYAESIAETSDAVADWWSLRKPEYVETPTPRDPSWSGNPVDAFILAKLEQEGMIPAEPCDKRSLIRRATFDLTGLPPTPAEIESFLADDSEGAFSKVIRRLLASPHYGERWGRHWLDLVRYADLRDAFRYRDWVVSALNRDMPYDKFIRYQLAGDLIPTDDGENFNPEGIIATGLLAIGAWGISEADKAKMMTNIVDDQIDVVGRVFMGLTTSCARCHDHRYDPITSEDYYALAGIFFSTHIIPEPGSQTHGSKRLRVPLLPQHELDEVHRHQQRLAHVEEQIQTVAEQAYRDYAARSIGAAGQYLFAAGQYRCRAADEADIPLSAFAQQRGLDTLILRQWLDYITYRPFRHAIRDIQVARPPGRQGVHAWSAGPKSEVEAFATAWVGVNSNEIPVGISVEDDRGNAVSDIILWKETVAAFPPPDGAVVIAWKSPLTGSVVINGRIRDADVVSGDGVAWQIVHERGPILRTLASGDLPNDGQQEFKHGTGADKLSVVQVDAGDMLRLEIHAKANNRCDTSLVDWIISAEDGDHVWDLAEDIVGDLHETWTGRGNPHADSLDNPDVWYFFDTQKHPAASHWQQSVQANDPASDQGPFWLNPRIDLDYLPPKESERLARLRAERNRLKQQPVQDIPYAVASQEGGVPSSPHAGVADARIHIGGRYERLGDQVPRGVIRALAGKDDKPIGAGSGRLELADWIASPDHPLTARVMVNRIWQHHFGAGIVRTPDNFGATGELPTHPELLDFLARYFVQSGWSIKDMHRLMMQSSTYQQASFRVRNSECGVRSEGGVRSAEFGIRNEEKSIPHSALRTPNSTDPDNRYLGHMSRRRLESEAIRDSILAVSGNLDRTVGGMADDEIMEPRRTLYLSNARSGGLPFHSLFDAPDPSAIAGQRDVSTVAPQALFVLNHPFFVRQAQLLAERIANEETDDETDDEIDVVAKIGRVHQLLYGRPPHAQEIEIAFKLLGSPPASTEEGFEERFEERATTWEEYCHILLASNEFIYID